jgi:hypothetical protein
MQLFEQNGERCVHATLKTVKGDATEECRLLRVILLAKRIPMDTYTLNLR